MARKFGSIIILLLILGACTAAPPVSESPSHKPENLTDAKDPVLYLGIMVHLEGWTQEISNEDMFNKHVGYIREYADLFEKYRAKLTWESKEVTEASKVWGDNILLEMEQRGHGIGVHADVGGNKDYDCTKFASDIRILKEDLEDLGVAVRHVSGVVSHCDWVTATIDAGYDFNTGIVTYALMSLPEELRPEEYKNCRTPMLCHGQYPEDLAGRLHPWRMVNGSNWIEPNPKGRSVILPSSEGLACYEEAAAGDPCDQFFTLGDINLFMQEIEEALTLLDPNRVNMYYVSWSLGKAIDIELMETWLQRIQPFIDSGQIEWKTLPEIYDAFIAWER